MKKLVTGLSLLSVIGFSIACGNPLTSVTVAEAPSQPEETTPQPPVSSSPKFNIEVSREGDQIDLSFSSKTINLVDGAIYM